MNEHATRNRRVACSLQREPVRPAGRAANVSDRGGHGRAYLPSAEITCAAALITAAIRPTSRSCVTVIPCSFLSNA
ncbi:hypothetical protein X942_5573 [Burkholderia pseudomallei MSHR5596]|nr:hypothetical protein X942_5573 [Burkholderia pseudomallei MSHR5596]